MCVDKERFSVKLAFNPDIQRQHVLTKHNTQTHTHFQSELHIQQTCQTYRLPHNFQVQKDQAEVKNNSETATAQNKTLSESYVVHRSQ